MAGENRAVAGARAKILIDGVKEAGWATGISGTVSTQLERVRTLGNIKTQAIEPVDFSVAFTCDFVRILKKPLKELGIRPEGDTATIINFPPMTFEVYDTVGDKPLFRFKGAVAEQFSVRVDARGMVSHNVSFQAIDFEELAG